MDDLPSSWPLRYKVLAVVLFVSLLALWSLVWTGVVKALPTWLVGYLFVGGMCGAVGCLIGEWYTKRHLARTGQLQHPRERGPSR